MVFISLKKLITLTRKLCLTEHHGIKQRYDSKTFRCIIITLVSFFKSIGLFWHILVLVLMNIELKDSRFVRGLKIYFTKHFILPFHLK